MPFWTEKSLSEMNSEEWEALCDGCGRCCLHKIEDENSGRIYYSRVACRLLDRNTGRCSDYPRRHQIVPDCVSLTTETLQDSRWLPRTCAYRLMREGRPLPDWHPLLSGSPLSVLRAGQSVAGRVIGEDEAGDISHHLISWVR